MACQSCLRFPGWGSFHGSTIHARVYKNATPYEGKRTLVVGCGNSGAEIALDFATGYTPALDQVIKGFEAVDDARGRPNRLGEESGIPGLYLFGFKNPPTGALREIADKAPRVAPVHPNCHR